ncbi:MAG: alpha/beta fold hydrolase [Candidatus Omnitrophota bacterium]
MKKLYLILITVICISAILFVATFFYIDTHRRGSFIYNIYENDLPVSSARVDKYNTEDQIVYKSVTETPLRSITGKYKRKLSIDKNGLRVHGYNKKYFSGKVNMNVYIKPVDSTINFLAVGHSNFCYAERLPVDKEFAVFEREAIVSYFNLMDKYDFKDDRAQTLPILTHSYAFLPPQKNTLEIRLEGEEVVKVNNKKMRTLFFRIKLPDKREALMWANWWNHVPLIIEIPKDKYKAVLSNTPLPLSVKKYKAANDLYLVKEITFKNKDVTLSGTLSLPNGEGPFPAIILVWGAGPQDREGLGLFSDIADGLTQNGVAVLRFDKRGVGDSGGNFSKYTSKEITEDISKAIDFIADQPMIDKEKIAILGHSEGGRHAATLAASNPNISACIIMAGIDIVDLPDTDLEMMWRFNDFAKEWDKDYIKDIAKSANDTADILKSGQDWAILLHKRVYLKKRRLDGEGDSLSIARKIKMPLLILGAKKDTVIPHEHIKSLEEALKESGNKDYEILYFSKLNHFFGEMVIDGATKTRLALDKEVLPAILKWLDKKMISPPEPEPVHEAASQQLQQTETIAETSGDVAAEDIAVNEDLNGKNLPQETRTGGEEGGS